jgi:GT2 family glycosyltransferase
MEGIDTPDELFVVFQGETNPELEATVRTRFPGAAVLWASNRGASAARNTGAGRARSDVIAFIDDDCRADSHWLKRYRQLFFDRPDVGIAGGQVIAERSQPSNRVLLAVQDSPHGYEITARANPVGKLDRGGNLAIRRRVFGQLSGFDQTLGTGTAFPGAEDTDFIYRAMLARIRMIYIPAAVVVHAQWRSPAEAARAERGYAAGIGAFIVPRIKKRDWYGASLGPRLLWHLGLRPVCAGLVQRKPERVASGLRYLTGIPKGIWKGRSRNPELWAGSPGVTVDESAG